EAALRESEQRYGLVTQAVAEGIYDWDIANNALWVSSRLVEIFGWNEAGTGSGARPSEEWNERVHPEDFAQYRAALRAALKREAHDSIANTGSGCSTASTVGSRTTPCQSATTRAGRCGWWVRSATSPSARRASGRCARRSSSRPRQPMCSKSSTPRPAT